LQLIPLVAEAFTQERITASHANLIARLPQESRKRGVLAVWTIFFEGLILFGWRGV
jgi:ParB family chromosome partitioning protein